MAAGCGVTETLYGNQVKGVVSQEYGAGYDSAKDFVKVPVMKGGECPCSAGVKGPVAKLPMQLGGAGGTCTGGTPMLKALGIMAGGRKRRSTKRSGGKRSGAKRSGANRSQTKKAAFASCKCWPFSGGKGKGKRSSYKATARNCATLRKYKAGKSIGFTARSSLKAKGLIPRSNGTYKVSPKYR